MTEDLTPQEQAIAGELGRHDREQVQPVEDSDPVGADIQGDTTSDAFLTPDAGPSPDGQDPVFQEPGA